MYLGRGQPLDGFRHGLSRHFHLRFRSQRRTQFADAGTASLIRKPKPPAEGIVDLTAGVDGGVDLPGVWV